MVPVSIDDCCNIDIALHCNAWETAWDRSNYKAKPIRKNGPFSKFILMII